MASNRDDSVMTGNLELQVGVVGDGHGLGIAWLAQDGVIGLGKSAISKVSVSM